MSWPLVMPVVRASADGKFYTRYPQGNAPVPNAILGAAGARSTGLGTLSSLSQAPTNVQVITQGTSSPNNATMFQCTSATAQCPGFSEGYTVYFGNNQSTSLCQIGWQGVSSASNYRIYRSTNGGAYVLIATITAAVAASNYASYVSNQGSNPTLANINCAYTDNAATNVVSGLQYPPVNVAGNVSGNVLTVNTVNNNASSGTKGTVLAGQGIGGPGLLPGTTINAYGSGGTSGAGSTGTYQLSQAATGPQSGTYGTQYFPNTAYTYYVEAEVGGNWSAPSAFAILPYIVDGQYILSGGNFGTGTAPGTAPATTPLGYGTAMQWSATSSASVMGLYAGNSAADQALNVAGYQYFNAAFYTTAPGVNFLVQTEVPGDNVILSLEALSNLGSFGNLTPNTWNVYKIPVSGVYVDKAWSGSGVAQNSWYKIIFQYNYGTVGSATIFFEMWLSVN